MDRADLQSQLNLIPGVLGANLSLGPNETLTEVHVLADQSRKAREVMLDVKSLLSVALQQQIDFRIISVAQVDTSRSEVAATSDSLNRLRLVLVAAYMRRLSGTATEGVVELRAGDEEIVGRCRAQHGAEPVTDTMARAFADALKDVLPSHAMRSRVQFMSSYCIADVQLLHTLSGETDDMVGAVKSSGDQPWDICRAVLSSLNRRLEVLMPTASI